MHRDLEQLTSRPFDVVVVGGGIYGLIVACDAAQRGLSVALIEKNDFGSGSSFNHLRTIHGGLRYLQRLDIGRARESIRERRTLARIAPRAIQPQAFVLPLTRSLTRGPLAMRAGFLLDRLVANDRNADVPPTHELAAGRVLPTREAVRRFPMLDGIPLAGAAVWYDYVTVDAERLTFSWAVSAAAHGAVLANYVEATEIVRDGSRIAAVRARDSLTGNSIDIQARVVVNATGAAVDRLLTPLGASTGMPLLKAMNLVTTRAAGDAAIGSRSESGRNLFLVPRGGRALFGTWESPDAREADDLAVRPAEVDQFIAELNAAFRGLNLRREEVSLVHRGVVPAVRLSGGRVALEGRDRIRDHAADRLEGLISVAGTKYTTARAVAERIVDLVCTKLRRPGLSCRSATLPLPWSNETGDALLAQAARDEMVATLADAVLRRTNLGALGLPAEDTLRHAAAVVGAVLGWSDERQRAEIAAVRRLY